MKLAVVACLLAASPAWSLSCLRPDIVRTYEMARDAEAGFWIVHGQIATDRDIALPQPDANGRYKDNATAKTPVNFVGLGLLSDGKYKGFAQNITLTVTCFGHWCGSPPLGQHIFAAIEITETGPELILDPCNTRAIPFSEEANRRLLNCVKNGVCQTE